MKIRNVIYGSDIVKDKMCKVLLYSQSYVDYWNRQLPPPKIDGNYLTWPDHKWDVKYGNCLRCGAYYRPSRVADEI